MDVFPENQECKARWILHYNIFKEILSIHDQTVTNKALFDILRSEILQNFTFYNASSDNKFNILKDLDLFISNPLKYYFHET